MSAFVALSACEQNSFVPPPPPKVEVGLPVQRNVTRYLEATGNTAPIKTVDLVARVQGVLQSINYQDGTLVKEAHRHRFSETRASRRVSRYRE
jgi:multidrug efflux pump subunit AcrA (membrane-fusion protein)